MRYEFYYWPMIQGRGEFVRLALEDAGADYVDVAREPEANGLGMAAMTRIMQDASAKRPPFAPPFLKVGDQFIAQTANILAYLGPRLGLAPADEAGRTWAHQLQLTVTDFVKEAHDTHHPIASSLYYEDQKPEAIKRSADFLAVRLPKYFGYFQTILDRNGGQWMVGDAVSHVDLSIFQIVAGMRYAFPKAMARQESAYAKLIALHDRIALRARLKAYLESPRRIQFNDYGIFRRYPELDG